MTDEDSPNRMEHMQVKRKRGRPKKLPPDTERSASDSVAVKETDPECDRCKKGRLQVWKTQKYRSENVPGRLLVYRWRRCSACGADAEVSREEVNQRSHI